MTIWKFPLQFGTGLQVKMPRGAKILTAQVQKEKLCIWAIVDPENNVEVRNFSVAITGSNEDMVEGLFKDNYIGTFQMAGGEFVGHLFEEK